MTAGTGCASVLLRCAMAVILFFLPVQQTTEPDDPPWDSGVDLEELMLPWYEFEATTGDGGLRPLYRPFEYERPDGSKDEQQAFVFAHLLSYRFDLVPDNNSHYHPFFVFKRDPVLIERLNAEPSPELFTEYAAEWGGSHVFGGKVIEKEGLFGGRLEVHDDRGALLFEKQYPVELGYFELLGTMAVDWMDFRSQHVSDELLTELLAPMCSNFDSVRLLGIAAVAEERSQREWRIYERILDLTPEFGEVRHWYANQRQWEDGDIERGQIERAKALQDRLVLRALIEFRPTRCPDPELVESVAEALERAREISPSDPRLVTEEINERNENGALTLKEHDAYLWALRQWPSCIELQDELVWRYRTRNALEKSMPIAISALRSGAVRASGGPAGEWAELAIGFALLGDFDRALGLTSHGLRQDGSAYDRSILHTVAGICMRELGRPADAAFTLSWSIEEHDSSPAFALACLALLESGDSEDARLQALLVDEYWRPLLEAWVLFKKGNDRELLDQHPLVPLGECRRPKSMNDETRLVDLRLELAILRAQAARRAKDAAAFAEAAHHALLLGPHSRRAFDLWQEAHGLREDARAVHSFLRSSNGRELPKATATPPERLEEALEERQRLLETAQSLSDTAQRRFWWNRPAWSVERLTLDLVHGGRLEEGLTLYLEYARAAQEVSDAQDIHGRTFVRKLLTYAPEETRTDWQDRLSAFPSGPGWHYGRMGYRLFHEDEHEAALPLLQKGLRTRKDGDNWYAYHAGYCLRELERPAEAIAYFDSYLKTRQTDYVALHEKAKCLRMLGRLDEALSVLESSVQASGDRPAQEAEQELLEVALLVAEEQPDEAARATLAKVEAMVPANAVLLKELAKLAKTLGRDEESETYRTRALEAEGAQEPER